MKTAKICILWDVWADRTVNRILVDLLTLKRFYSVKNTQLIVAARPELHSFLSALNLSYTQDFGQISICLVYILKGREIPDEVLLAIPENVQRRICYLYPNDQKQSTLYSPNKEPYSGFPLPYPGKVIAPTMMPRYYRPRTITEPLFAPLL
jgi:hypothetical protein